MQAMQARPLAQAPLSEGEAEGVCARHPDFVSTNAAVWACVGEPAAAFADLGA